MTEKEHELRQYFEDLYITFLGSAMKNGHALNPDAILKDTETHFKALIKHMKELKTEEI
jgi:hypothetical protein